MANGDKTTYIEIDGDRLKKSIDARGLVCYQVQTDLGCGRAISNAIVRGKIAQPIMTLLDSKYGITLEEIAPATETESKVERNPVDEIIIAPQISEEQWERLGTLIKQSILDAFKEYL